MNNKNIPFIRIFGFLVVIFLILPTLFIIPMSFNSSQILEFPPSGFSLQWYLRIFSDSMWSKSITNSLVVALSTSILATVLGTLAAYAIVRGNFPGKNVISALLIAPLIIPVVMVAIGMFSVYVRHGLTGNMFGLVLAHTSLSIPFVLVMVSTSLRTIELNLELAARGLGANRWRTFIMITFPLSLPGMAAGALFSFITSWDEVVAALFLTTARFRTLPVQMWSQLSERVDPSVAAVSTLLLVVTTSLSVGLLILNKR
jgi:putative spermidine/putrescine transport system permease protein